MTQALSAFGTLLKRGDSGAPENFTIVGEVRDISGPSIEVDEIEVTTHNSAIVGNFREFIASLLDAGEVEVELNHVPSDATHIGIRTDLLNRTVRNWQIVAPGGIETVTFAAFVKKRSPEYKVDDVMLMKVSFRVTGKPTWT